MGGASIGIYIWVDLMTGGDHVTIHNTQQQPRLCGSHRDPTSIQTVSADASVTVIS